MSKKRKDKIKISFVGENAHDVTGSMTLVEFGSKHKILIDVGLYQGNSASKDYKINARNFKGFKPSEITEVFLEHKNIDHIGLTPKLFKEGCNADIYIPSGSSEIMKLLLNDCAYIVGKNAKYLDLKPIYEDFDVDKTMSKTIECNFNMIHKIDDELSFRYTPSGHIFKAAQLELFITINNQTKRILYTGDLGNIAMGKKSFVDEFKPVDFANMVIGETTYAGNLKSADIKTREKDIEKIRAVVNEVCIDKKKGRILIPCFSLDRTQTTLKLLYDMYKDDKNFNCPVVLDSPLAIKISKIYSEILEGKEKEEFDEMMAWHNLRILVDLKDSKISVTDKSPAIILSASGFMVGGRVMHYLENMIGDPDSVCMFVGYSSPESLAGKIKEGKQKTITINGIVCKNRCKVVELKSFSSHMQHNELLDYYSSINSKAIYLVHGNMSNKVKFAQILDDKLRQECKTTKVYIADKGDVVEI